MFSYLDCINCKSHAWDSCLNSKEEEEEEDKVSSAYLKGGRTQFHFQIQFQILGFVWVCSSHLRYVKVPLNFRCTSTYLRWDESSAATPLARPIASLNFRCTFTYLRWDESSAATPLSQPIASNSAHIIINYIGWASCTFNILRGSVFFFFLFFCWNWHLILDFLFLYAYIIFILITIDLTH